MSFSSRVIMQLPPPASKQVRYLGLMLWTAPILLSCSVILLSPRGSDAIAREMVNNSGSMAFHTDVADLQDLMEPASFARAGSSPYIRTALHLPLSSDAVFPMALEPWRTTAFSAGKIALQAEQERPRNPDSSKNPAPAHISSTEISDIQRMSKLNFGEAVTFRRVKVLGPTAILADNTKILLADVEPMPPEISCKRIDGVIQSCIERAEHRLAILLQARSITCEMSEPLTNGIHLGRCTADKIDIAGDLVRQKLAQRPSRAVVANYRPTK